MRMTFVVEWKKTWKAKLSDEMLFETLLKNNILSKIYFSVPDVWRFNLNYKKKTDWDPSGTNILSPPKIFILVQIGRLPRYYCLPVKKTWILDRISIIQVLHPCGKRIYFGWRVINERIKTGFIQLSNYNIYLLLVIYCRGNIRKCIYPFSNIRSDPLPSVDTATIALLAKGATFSSCKKSRSIYSPTGHSLNSYSIAKGKNIIYYLVV